VTIQWFPGHMAKARRQVQERLKVIDVVVELVDARLPASSRNPMIDEIVGAKPRLLLLNKADLADPRATTAWINWFAAQGLPAMPIDAQSGKGVERIATRCKELARPVLERRIQKGMAARAVRAMILGIPNVGKSTLINRLAGRAAARVGDRPAVTKAQQWVRVGRELELLDTPGILWPKFDDPEVGLKLAATGAIKDEILPLYDVALFAVRHLMAHYPERLRERYKLTAWPDDAGAMLEHIGRVRGCLVSGGAIDVDKAAEVFLRDLRAGRLGPLTFDWPPEAAEERNNLATKRP